MLQPVAVSGALVRWRAAQLSSAAATRRGVPSSRCGGRAALRSRRSSARRRSCSSNLLSAAHHPSLPPPPGTRRLDAPFGTEENPVVVPSEFAERIVGVSDPDDDSLVSLAAVGVGWGVLGCVCYALCVRVLAWIWQLAG